MTSMSTTPPTRGELRASILGRLSTFAERVDWVGTGADLAFADTIIGFAQWFASVADDTCTAVLANRRGCDRPFGHGGRHSWVDLP